MRPFRIKICGITLPDDASMAARSGADAIGINFYERSPRSVDNSQAIAIAEAAGADVVKVGVFVNASPDAILRTATRVGLDWIQLHGDESGQFLESLRAESGERPRVLRAVRIQPGDVAAARRHVAAHLDVVDPPDAMLVDAFQPNAYGGTGACAPWEVVRALRAEWGQTPIVLAGGLTPENVRQAVEQAGPLIVGVDVASGVESSPGIKDPARVATFIREATAVLDR